MLEGKTKAIFNKFWTKNIMVEQEIKDQVFEYIN